MLPRSALVAVRQPLSRSNWFNNNFTAAHNRPELGLFFGSMLAYVDFSGLKTVQWPFHHFSLLGA